MTTRRTEAVELFWRIHRPLYRLSGGRILGRVMGMPVLLLDTVGRKSGQRRTNALTWLPKGDDFVVIAPVLGRIAVRAREAAGAERERLWAALLAQAPNDAEYQLLTERRIPVVVLERGRA